MWKIIRTGASSMENNISSSIDRVTLNLPPNSLAPLAQIKMMLSSLGRNNSTMVVENSATALSGCHCGHSGYNWRGAMKYCGSIRVFTASKAVDNTRKKNHNGADR